MHDQHGDDADTVDEDITDETGPCRSKRTSLFYSWKCTGFMSILVVVPSKTISVWTDSCLPLFCIQKWTSLCTGLRRKRRCHGKHDAVCNQFTNIAGDWIHLSTNFDAPKYYSRIDALQILTTNYGICGLNTYPVRIAVRISLELTSTVSTSLPQHSRRFQRFRCPQEGGVMISMMSRKAKEEKTSQPNLDSPQQSGLCSPLTIEY